MAIPFFPDLPGFAYPYKRTNIWSTLIQTGASGFEARMQLYSYPRWQWELVYNYLHTAPSGNFFIEWQTLAGFFNSVAGSMQSFFFRDPIDNTVTQQFIATAVSGQTTYQLQRTLQGSNEPVFGVDERGSAQYGPYTRPAAVTPQAYVNSNPATATFNTQNGQLTFPSAPTAGSTITATFSYLWLVRFLDDKLDFDTINPNIYEAKSVKLIQVVPD